MGEFCPRGTTVAGVLDRVGGDAVATVVRRCNPVQRRLAVAGGTSQAGWLTWGCSGDYDRRRC